MTDIYRSPEGGLAVQERYRSFLDHWPVPSEQLTVPTTQGDAFLVASGPADAPPLFLLHGSAGNAVVWMGDVSALAKHFRVYAVDMIGEPGLSAPSRPPLASGVYGPWLAEVWDGLGIQRASVVAMSLGGWLSLQFTTAYPERVEQLALLCPGGIGRQTNAKIILALFVRLFGKWGRRKAAQLILGTSGELPTSGPAKAFSDFFQLINKNFKPRMEKLPIHDDEALGRLTMPVLAIVGARDAMLSSAETKKRLESAVPQAKVTMLPEAGHLLTGYTQAVLDFLLANVRQSRG